MRKPQVCIVNMPWGMIQEPALGPSILAASLKESGVSASVEYLNLFLLKYLKFSSYTRIADVFALNDFIFSGSMDQNLTPKQQAVLEDITKSLWDHNSDWYDDPQISGPSDIGEYIVRLRQNVIPMYLEECKTKILGKKPNLVAFSCLYDQTIPSLALSRLLKEADPSISIAMGGYALKGPIGQNLLNIYNFVDFVVDGAGEAVIVELANRAQNKKSSFIKSSTKTVISRNDYMIEDSPTPDFSDFQNSLCSLDKQLRIKIDWRVLPYETSRGCWWGAKNHCIFCGIHKEDMRYRSKSSAKVLNDIAHLSRVYKKNTIRLVDYILPYEYFESLLPKLSIEHIGMNFTCELKSNIGRRKMGLLKAAGFAEIQPGIESFSTAVLKRINKGVSSVQNLQTMKLGLQNGIVVHYNFLYGFVFDQIEWYERILANIPKLFHLQPPATVVEVLTTRFSPMQEGRVDGVKRSNNPHNFYDLIFSQSYLQRTNFEMENYCYYFEQTYSTSEDLRVIYRKIVAKMQEWNRRFFKCNDVFLVFEVINETVVVFDSRNNDFKTKKLCEIESYIYLLVNDRVSGIRQIVSKASNIFDIQKVGRAYNSLVASGLIYEDDGKCIGLAIPRESLKSNRALDLAETGSLQTV